MKPHSPRLQSKISLDRTPSIITATAGVGDRPGGHATSRPAAFGASFCRLADVERPAGCRGVQDRPSACQNADAADGDRRAERIELNLPEITGRALLQMSDVRDICNSRSLT